MRKSWQPCLKVSTTTNFKISIENQTFTVLCGLKCEKLANNFLTTRHNCRTDGAGKGKWSKMLNFAWLYLRLIPNHKFSNCILSLSVFIFVCLFPVSLFSLLRMPVYLFSCVSLFIFWESLGVVPLIQKYLILFVL